MSKDYLYLSDDMVFGPTLEGEGEWAGYPTIFMRLSMCNLTCSQFKSIDSPFGCDSFISWSVKNKITFEEIFKIFEDRKYIDYLKDGMILKLSGGEPILQQKALLKFTQAFIDRYNFIPRIDFETNATILPSDDWILCHNATFTTSPKLRSNGDPEEKTYKPEVLKWHVHHGSGFKFVYNSDDDIKEIYDKYINSDIKVPKERVWLMPCCGSRDEHTVQSARVAEICKLYNLKFSPRLQLVIWNKALKV